MRAVRQFVRFPPRTPRARLPWCRRLPPHALPPVTTDQATATAHPLAAAPVAATSAVYNPATLPPTSSSTSPLQLPLISSIACVLTRFLGGILPGATMLQQSRFAGGLAGCLPPCATAAGGLLEDQVWALKDYGALLSAAAADDGWQYDSAAQSELTCNGGAAAAAVLSSRKRGREEELVPAPSALLPIPGMHQPAAAVASRMAESAMASTSGRPYTATAASSLADALVAEMGRQGAEVDALVQAECGRLLAGLERARKRQRLALARAAAAGAALLLRDREVELEAARRRAAELEERLRQAAAESQAWRGAARSSEAVAARLRAALASLLLAGPGAGAAAQPAAEEGFGDSGSCSFEDAPAVDMHAATATSSGSSKRACRACGGGEASVLLLPCRHLCLCRACEPRADACPVCLAPKSAAIHVAAD